MTDGSELAGKVEALRTSTNYAAGYETLSDIDISAERAKPDRYRVFYRGQAIGVWREPSCSAARYLVANGLAARSDRLRLFQGEQLCLTGGVGWFADRRVDESGTPRFVKWTPDQRWALIHGAQDGRFTSPGP